MPPGIRLWRSLWRVLAPRWAPFPLSGAGAARHGGRWNRPGTEALYLSLEIETAFAEYHQDIQRPGTLCRFDVDIGPVADLREEPWRRALGVTEAALLCAWKAIHLLRQGTPPTWLILDRLLAAGMAGALVPSAQRPSGTNLVLWQWNDGPDRKVAAYDPQDDLPRDQSSWG